MMWWPVVLLGLVSSCYVTGQVGNQFPQDFGYVEVRPGAHMFWWLYFTTAEVATYVSRPLVVWLQGGPGGSSTGIGNFEILGPLDVYMNERNHTWVKEFNVLFVDNPVGTGFSYVENLTLLTTTNDEIALDFVELLRGFYSARPEFEGVSLYIYGQSYGGKMAVDMGLRIREAEQEGSLRSNLRGIAMGNAWIEPVSATLSWAPLLHAAGLVDDAGHDSIMAAARQAEALFQQGSFWASTAAWAATQSAVFGATTNVDFYDITTKMPAFPDTRSTDGDAYERAREMMINDGSRLMRSGVLTADVTGRQQPISLNQWMNTVVHGALDLPAHVVWGSQSNAVFDYLRTDFMRPVTDGIERLLNETDIIVTKYNGNLDLICSTPGQLVWVDELRWAGAENYRQSPRRPLWEDGRLEGYYKSYGNFRYFWINVAGHSVPRDNPAGTRGFLRDMTSYG